MNLYLRFFLCKAHSIIPLLHVRLRNINKEFIEFIISVLSVFLILKFQVLTLFSISPLQHCSIESDLRNIFSSFLPKTNKLKPLLARDENN